MLCHILNAETPVNAIIKLVGATRPIHEMYNDVYCELRWSFLTFTVNSVTDNTYRYLFVYLFRFDVRVVKNA